MIGHRDYAALNRARRQWEIKRDEERAEAEYQTERRSKMEDRYLGDGVYASWDGYTLWLDTRAQAQINRIALEPSVLEQFDAYRRDIKPESPPEGE